MYIYANKIWDWIFDKHFTMYIVKKRVAMILKISTLQDINSFKYVQQSKLLWSLTIHFFDIFSVKSIYYPGTMVKLNLLLSYSII